MSRNPQRSLQGFTSIFLVYLKPRTMGWADRLPRSRSLIGKVTGHSIKCVFFSESNWMLLQYQFSVVPLLSLPWTKLLFYYSILKFTSIIEQCNLNFSLTFKVKVKLVALLLDNHIFYTFFFFYNSSLSDVQQQHWLKLYWK